MDWFRRSQYNVDPPPAPPSTLETRLPNLLPRNKVGRDRDASHLQIPSEFETVVGRRRVPRMIDPPHPTTDMISDARNGILSRYFRSGEIIRASDHVGMVNPKTAIITLADFYDYQTRPLSSVGQGLLDSEKSLRNLFYISVNHDELPSFHFWIGPGEQDPIELGKKVDWGNVFENEKASAATAFRSSDSESERNVKTQGGRGVDGEQDPTLLSTSTKLLGDRASDTYSNYEDQWGPEPDSMSVGYDVIRHNEDPLEFLDFYNEKSNGESMLRRRKAIPEEYINREAPNLIPPLDASAALHTVLASTKPGSSFQHATSAHTKKASSMIPDPAESSVLIHFRRGGMYLNDFKASALVDLARYLVENEEESHFEGKDMTLYLDIKILGQRDRQEYRIGSGIKLQRLYTKDVKPYFGRIGFQFRVRSPSFDHLSPFYVNDSLELKIVRPDVGHFYCYAGWNDSNDVKLNSAEFEKALNFLFSRPGSEHYDSDLLTLTIPGYGLFDIDRKSEVIVGAKMQRIFSAITGLDTDTDSVPGKPPAEIFVHERKASPTSPIKAVENEDLAAVSKRSLQMNVLSTNLDQTQPEQEQLGPIVAPRQQKQSERPASGDERVQMETRANISADVPFTPLPTFDSSQSSTHVPQPTPSPGPGIRGNPDVPSTNPRALTLYEIEDLQKQLRRRENEILKHEESCRICDKVFQVSSTEVAEHYLEHKQKALCPVCLYDWIDGTRQQQLDHLALHHDEFVAPDDKQKCPFGDCSVDLGAGSKHPTLQEIVQHLHTHIMEEIDEKDTCQAPGCHANFKPMTAEQKRQHLSGHRIGEKAIQERDDLRHRIRDLEEQKQPSSSHDKETQTQTAKPHSPVDAALGPPSQPSQPADPNKLCYCNICLKSVDKQTDDGKAKHASECETSVAEFVQLTIQEAKAERQRSKTKSKDKPKRTRGPRLRKGPTSTQSKAYKPLANEESDDEPDSAGLNAETHQVEAVNVLEELVSADRTPQKARKRSESKAYKPKAEEESDDELKLSGKRQKVTAKKAVSNPKRATSTETAGENRITRARSKTPKQPDEGEEEEERSAEVSIPNIGIQRKRKATARTRKETTDAPSKKAKTKR